MSLFDVFFWPKIKKIKKGIQDFSTRLIQANMYKQPLCEESFVCENISNIQMTTEIYFFLPV